MFMPGQHAAKQSDAIPAVHWLTQTTADVPADDFWLSARERAIAGKMYFEKRRRDWKLGRWTAKRAASSCLDLGSGPSDLTRLEIIAAADGAPEAFLDGKPAPAVVSISHSADLAFCCVSAHGIALGCDLEQIQPREPNFAADYFTREEVAFIERVAAPDRNLLINLIWSAKESALKALRQGLRRDTRSIGIQLPEARKEGWNSFTAVDLEQARTRRGWYRVQDDFVQTVTTDPPSLPPTRVP
jgi:4'-phosphopantetheinyl transferase